MNKELKISLDSIAVKRLENYPDRPTIIFLHDSLGCIKLWKNFPEKLGDITQCNILMYDRQGYGESCAFSYSKRNNDYLEEEADILIKLLDHWQLDKVILFGHSDGGSIALIAGAKYPERINAIVTEGAHIFVEDLTIAGIENFVEVYKTSKLKTILKRYHGEKTEAMFWAWAKTWTTKEFRDWNIENMLPMLKCPVLVLQGENDEYGTMAQVDGIVNKTNGKNRKLAQKFIVPNAKHTPHKEFPQIVLTEVAEFLEKQHLLSPKSRL